MWSMACVLKEVESSGNLQQEVEQTPVFSNAVRKREHDVPAVTTASLRSEHNPTSRLGPKGLLTGCMLALPAIANVLPA
jgi:hypothetical protein